MAEVIPHAVSRQSGYVASITRRRAELASLLWDLSKIPLRDAGALAAKEVRSLGRLG